MRQLHVEDNPAWIQRHIQVRLIIKVEKVAISEAEQIKLRKLTSKMTGAVCYDSRFMELMMTILNFAIVFEKK